MGTPKVYSSGPFLGPSLCAILLPMQPITTSVYSFENLRTGGFLYVDKTANILEFVRPAFGQYFLSRPRRFGKSLLISTLQCLFEGRKDLSQGLAIENQWDWSKTYPVLRFDMGSAQADSAEELKSILCGMVRRCASQFEIGLPESENPSVLFLDLCDRLSKKSPSGKIVILVDEYDKPLLGALGTPKVTEIKNVLKAFYSVVKTMEGLQRFALLTGVSKFSKVSVFSDLNNLTDLTMDARAATLLGYTHEEVRKYFDEGVGDLATANGLTKDEAYERLATMYDGFRFHFGSPSVFNPVSIGKCIVSKEYDNYWFETGTPTFLLEILKRRPVNLDNPILTALDFSVYEAENPAIMPLLVQTGYLTIKDCQGNGPDREYRLGFPNQEVSLAFSKSLAKVYTELPEGDFPSLLSQLVQALREGDLDEMLETLSCFFANIPSTITLKQEKYYQTIFYTVFLLVGARIQCEIVTNRGRADAAIETAAGVFVFEFKLRGTAAEAIAQIRAKGYAEKYRASGKKVTLVGVAFDEATRNLGERIVEPL